MTAEHTGQRAKALAEAMGVTPEAVAAELETSVSTVYRWYGRADWPGRRVREFERVLGVPLRKGDFVSAPPPADTTKPATSETTGGLAGVERHSPEWWSGYQRAALHMMEHAASMQDTAIKMQRELIAATYPTPREITPEQQAALDDAERAVQLRDAVRAEQRASGAKRRGERAG